MKSKGGAGFVKQIMSCVSRAKCIAMIRSKTDAIKAQLMVTALSRKNKFSIRALFAKNNAIDDDSKDRDLTEDDQVSNDILILVTIFIFSFLVEKVLSLCCHCDGNCVINFL